LKKNTEEKLNLSQTNLMEQSAELILAKRQAVARRLGLTVEQIPRHIAIIMDGNGRWAKRRSLPRFEGHRQGAHTAEKIAQCCVDLGIESLTLYSLSSENWKRPKAEVNALMHLHTQYLIGIRPKLMKNNVKLIHLGQLEGLPTTVKQELIKTLKKTSRNTGMLLGLALNYGGRAESPRRPEKLHRNIKRDNYV
jgi:undecaprenyl diphosphate synthase